MQVEVKNLSFQYDAFGAHSDFILKDINLTLRDGEFTALLGTSGSGKTTLMQQFTGLLVPQSGTILIDGSPLFSKQIKLSEVRRRIGLIFQFPEKHLFEETVHADVAFGPGNLNLSPEEVERRVQYAMKMVGLDITEFGERLPFHLSEGEKRRVAIAGTLAMEPEFLILDEPTAGLDRAGVQAVVQIIQNFYELGKSVLLISHDLELALSLARRIVILQHGEIIYDGLRDPLFHEPNILKQAGLAVPKVFQLCETLTQANLIEKRPFFSTDELKNAISFKKEADNGITNTA